MECSECTPSIIARLMGLDELPPRQSVQKQCRVFSDNYLRRVASIGVREKRSSRGRNSFRMGLEEQQEIKDVRDVFYNLSVEKERVDYSSSETDVELTRQKLDVKWKEFHDAVDIDNCFLNYLQKLDFSTKLLNNLEGVSPHSQSWKTTVLKPSSASKHRNMDTCRKLGRTVEEGNSMSPPKLEDSLVTDSHRELNVGKMHKCLRSHLELKESPLMISVLKLKSPISYGDSRSGAKNHKEFISFDKRNLYVEAGARKNLVEDDDKPAIMKNFKLSRDTSKEILGKKAKGDSKGLKELSGSKCIGGKLSLEDSALMLHSSPVSSFSKKQYQLVSNLDESFTAREGKKRISERWKTTQKSLGVGIGSRGVTLAEMFAMPDHETRPINSHTKIVKHGLSNQIGFSDVIVTFGTPLDIGSEDVWKDGLAENNHSVQDKLNTKLEYMNLSGPNSVVPKSSVTTVVSSNLIADMVTNAEAEFRRKELQFELPTCKLLVKDYDSSSTSFQQEISTGVPENDFSCSSGTYMESFVNLDKVYLPSPDSVLEPPFKEEISSCSGSFESFNDDFHESSESSSEGSDMTVSSDEDAGKESGGYSKEYTYFGELFRLEESRDFSYLVDVLTEAGFHGRNLDIGVDTCHTPEYPISHLVFEKLETCREKTSWKRSERRLLFDRINSVLMDILQPHMGVPSWSKPVTFMFNLRQSWVVTEEELWMSLVSQEKEARNSYDKMLGRGIGWLELGDDTEVIVREIESVLTDELVAELVSSTSF